MTLFIPDATSAMIGSSDGSRAGAKGRTVALIAPSPRPPGFCLQGAIWPQSGNARAVLIARVAMNDAASPPADPVLAGFRRSIDNFDAALVHILAERFRTTQAVGRYKAENALPASDPGREERQIARLRKLAEDADLDPEFTEKFLRFIIDEVIRHHRQANAK